MRIQFCCQPISDSLVQLSSQGLPLDAWVATLDFVRSIQFPWGLSGELELILADQSIACVLPYPWQLQLGAGPFSSALQDALDKQWAPKLVKHLSKPIQKALPKVHSVPVKLGGELGPDLADVLKSLKLSLSEFSRLLFGAELTVQFVGFLPGFAYLTGLPKPLCQLPRRDSPRQQVPAQSFAMAGGYCAVYPLQSPGGWHLLGTSPIHTFDVSVDPPALFKAGDKVRLTCMN